MVTIREVSDEDLGRKHGHVPSKDSANKEQPVFSKPSSRRAKEASRKMSAKSGRQNGSAIYGGAHRIPFLNLL